MATSNTALANRPSSAPLAPVMGTGTPGATTPGPTDVLSQLLDNLSGPDRDAAAAVLAAFDAYGLSSLGNQIVNFVKQGYTADTINILLQQTPEYKTRFAGNTARLAAGMSVLSPAEYLSTEDSYRQIMSAAGLPPGFYDAPSDFADFIGKDVSPTELQGRVQVASALVNAFDPGTVGKFQQFYGSGNLVAYALDPQRAEPIVEQQLRAAQIASKDQGLNISQQTAESLAGQGFTGDQASAGFGQVKANLEATQPLAAIYGDTYTQDDAIAEIFGNNADAAAKRRRLSQQEEGAFGGTTAVGQGSFSTDAGRI